MEFRCTICGRKHVREGTLIDEHFACECGHEIYVFYNEGMLVVMPYNDFIRYQAVQAFRFFVVSTGRCRDARVTLQDFSDFLNTVDPLALIQVGMERYQKMAKLKKCYMNSGDIAIICKNLKRNRDMIIKIKGDHVDIDVIQSTNKEREVLPFIKEPIAYLNEEYALKGWQKEIMEEDAARTGYLFGDIG